MNRQASIAAVVYQADNSDSEAKDIKKVLSITDIGKHKVKCYIPNRDIYKCGVISPIDINEDLVALQEDMQDKCDQKMIKLERLGRITDNNNLVSSLSVKVTFEGTCLPATSRCGYFTYRIRPYIYNPT